jgi:phosphatidylglycerophosphate synthase
MGVLHTLGWALYQPFKPFGLANWVSVGRMVVAFALVAVLTQQPPGPANGALYTWAVVLTVAIIAADALDGYVARALNESSPAGAVVDILADRTVEVVYWVAFAAWQWVPLWVPLVVLTRGLWVDGLRAVALQQGYTAFGSSTLLQHPLSVALTSSRFSRAGYAVLKALVFVALLALHHPQWGLQAWQPSVGQGLVWATVAFCVVRGLPVLVEGPRFLAGGHGSAPTGPVG